MKKFMILASLVAFIAVVSCNTNPPTPPSNYEQQLTELFDYWPYTIGDSLAYVNEIGDSIILVVITDSTSFSYHPNYNPENDSDEGPCEMMDEFKIYFVCSSPRNSFNRNDLKFSTSCQYTNYREARIYFDCYSPTPPMYKLNAGITWNYNINNNNDSLLKFFSDSVRLRRSAPNSPETNYIEEYGDLIRGKGVVRWTDLDGHQWRLVDLMNK